MLKPKNDIYRKRRGGTSTFLEIYCGGCKREVALYQKDGPGGLHRLYLNRIFAPPALEKLQREDYSLPTELSNLVCEPCDVVIGVPMIHGDGRFAYRLVKGTFYKKKHKGKEKKEKKKSGESGSGGEGGIEAKV